MLLNVEVDGCFDVFISIVGSLNLEFEYQCKIVLSIRFMKSNGDILAAARRFQIARMPQRLVRPCNRQISRHKLAPCLQCHRFCHTRRGKNIEIQHYFSVFRKGVFGDSSNCNVCELRARLSAESSFNGGIFLQTDKYRNILFNMLNKGMKMATDRSVPGSNTTCFIEKIQNQIQMNFIFDNN